jgi:hypothetical protein
MGPNVTGALILTSDPDIDIAVALSLDGFIDSLQEGDRTWARKATNDTDGTVFEKIIFFGEFIHPQYSDVLDETNGRYTCTLDFDDWWHDYNEKIIEHFASLGMGVEGEFNDAGDIWTYDVAFGSGKLELDTKEPVASKYLTFLESTRDALDEIGQIVFPGQWDDDLLSVGGKNVEDVVARVRALITSGNLSVLSVPEA